MNAEKTRKLSIPIVMNEDFEKNMDRYVEELKKCKADRVFLSGLDGEIYQTGNDFDENPEKVKKAIKLFKDAGFEVGIWIGAFGHGSVLSHQREQKLKGDFTRIEGIRGESFAAGYCPMDENFKKVYYETIKKIAKMNPDMIMLDDDFRINARGHYLGCFCPAHLEEYYKRIGQEIPRNELEKLILTGGKNKYRTAYLTLMGDTLLDFAKGLRAVVDTVNPDVRLGICVCYDNWDLFPGPIEYCKALAGNTKPFMRSTGAPYWNPNVIGVIEDTRMETEWCMGSGIEFFTEGDPYPRPRYNSPSKSVEMFDIALAANGRDNGILKYILDYHHNPDYEKGYVEHHMRNEKNREEIAEIFSGKIPVGVRSYNVMRKLEDYVCPDELEDKIFTKLIKTYKSSASVLLSQNSIPTTYMPGDDPLFICGENARHVDFSELSNGAILDIRACEILKSRGLDTGLISAEPFQPKEEYFVHADESAFVLDNDPIKKICCSENATVLSYYVPENVPAAYLYENADGIRLCVLSQNVTDSQWFRNFRVYYRQEILMKAAEWVSRKKLPVKITRYPNLYVLASKGDGKMSVLLINHFMDEVFSPVIELDKEYTDIRFVNCSGRLDKNKVYLDDMHAYSFAAFEVK